MQAKIPSSQVILNGFLLVTVKILNNYMVYNMTESHDIKNPSHMNERHLSAFILICEGYHLPMFLYSKLVC